MSPFDEIKSLYFNTTRTTIERDFSRAIDLLKAMPTEEARERAAVYMDGLAEMRKEWAAARKDNPPKGRSPRE
jgi:hypothetical protein